MKTYEDLHLMQKRAESLYEDMQDQADHVQSEQKKLDAIQIEMSRIADEIEQLEVQLGC